MTTPADLHRLLHRIANSVNVAEARLHHATEAIRRQQADSYPTRASGNATGTNGGTSELTAVEQAADTNLGDLYGYDDTYRPGPLTRLADIADELHAALHSLDRAHNSITDCGIPPLITHQYRCHGINAQGCIDWADTNRTDHLCIDCGRQIDSNRRRLRRHQAS